MPNIGIVGSGIAGLHLGLYLRKHDIDVTIYSDKTAEQLAGGRLLNTVAHHRTTLERETELGVDHWDLDEYGYFCNHHYIGGPEPLYFRGDFPTPSRALDYRVYLPRLAQDFEERGGTLEVRPVTPSTIVDLSERHDIMVISTGRAGLGAMFARRADKSPYDSPQRNLAVGLYHGVADNAPKGLSLSVSPGHGELLEIPMYSHEGHVTGLLFEAIPGASDLNELSLTRYDEDPAAFEKLVLAKLQQHFPGVFERVDPNLFSVTRPQDVLQGGVTPVVREDYTRLPNGKYAIALGDAHLTVDPMIGQGANTASYSAFTVGAAIVEDLGFDERLCERIANRRAGHLMSAAEWANFMVRREPAPHLLELFATMAEDDRVCRDVVDNFNFPERQWDIMSSAERTHAYLASFAA
ncbi:2-polyprenyl-6-methoxyphenol hydroxylase-like FAD-dependent oxidoreductase [Actinokineospora baliensis]|uniref:styrene monooxygenase/indole monooxygenase family protein n=1 Tax=Actinokineospora baliensis TaxID=547056 RepID=UPI00195A106F|nr:styrene monooxygenase/indole monooxygenase family protein [Actinokineospora baliensis]MBM7773184.1 2-polyprenyl-6-methoxyphenol hydroxylase-like FAD-dependent oxidoreductase [Actinokineospora baliensis]